MDAKNTTVETYTLFTARLKNLLIYNVRRRTVNGEYDRLFDLLVADKLKVVTTRSTAVCVVEGRSRMFTS